MVFLAEAVCLLPVTAETICTTMLTILRVFLRGDAGRKGRGAIDIPVLETSWISPPFTALGWGWSEPIKIHACPKRLLKGNGR